MPNGENGPRYGYWQMKNMSIHNKSELDFSFPQQIRKFSTGPLCAHQSDDMV
jgi:hypothetical protein